MAQVAKIDRKWPDAGKSGGHAELLFTFVIGMDLACRGLHEAP